MCNQLRVYPLNQEVVVLKGCVSCCSHGECVQMRFLLLMLLLLRFAAFSKFVLRHVN